MPLYHQERCVDYEELGGKSFDMFCPFLDDGIVHSDCANVALNAVLVIFRGEGEGRLTMVVDRGCLPCLWYTLKIEAWVVDG